MEKEIGKCEAVYGNKRCENQFTTLIGSKGLLFRVCNECAKQIRRQNKLE